jgi:dTDP-4-dehydrorhamnose 3,5-epimerase
VKFTPTALSGVIVVEPSVHRDDRGFFFEHYHRQKFHDGGIKLDFVQDNHSRSTKGILRGLHVQLSKPQGKLVRVVRGEVFDVAVDLRLGSPTFKKWTGTHLSEENFREMWVPPGFAHGFLVLSDVAEVEYKCTALYDPKDEAGIIWNDPEIAVAWPASMPILSAKDKALPPLKDVIGKITGYPAYRL